MPFKYAYITRGGGMVHAVARHNKAVQTFPTEQQAREEADRLNRRENDIKTPQEKADWARYWNNVPDRRPSPGSNVVISQTAGRRIMPGSPTPWGEAQQAVHLGAGVHQVTCAGHGGLYLPDPVWDLLPPAVRQSMHLQGWGQYPKNWAEEDCDLPVIMPFILHLLDQHAVQQEFGERGTDPAYWRRRAEYVCQAYTEKYGAALNDIQALPTPDPAD